MGEPILLNIQTINVMAKFDSSLIYKANGSVGNVTLYQLNGQNVVRERNFHPYDPKTPAQLAQRQKLKNASWAYNWLKYFLNTTQEIAGAGKILQNYWSGVFTKVSPSSSAQSLPIAASYMTGQNFSGGTLGVLSKITYQQGSGIGIAQISFSKNIDVQWSENMRIKLFTWAESGENYTSQFNLTESMWNSSIIEIGFQHYGNFYHCVTIYDLSTNNSSNVCMLSETIDSTLLKLSNVIFKNGRNPIQPTPYFNRDLNNYNLSYPASSTISLTLIKEFQDQIVSVVWKGNIIPVIDGNCTLNISQNETNNLYIKVFNNENIANIYTVIITRTL